jgi:hypothetical protein
MRLRRARRTPLLRHFSVVPFPLLPFLDDFHSIFACFVPIIFALDTGMHCFLKSNPRKVRRGLCKACADTFSTSFQHLLVFVITVHEIAPSINMRRHRGVVVSPASSCSSLAVRLLGNSHNFSFGNPSSHRVRGGMFVLHDLIVGIVDHGGKGRDVVA